MEKVNLIIKQLITHKRQVMSVISPESRFLKCAASYHFGRVHHVVLWQRPDAITVQLMKELSSDAVIKTSI